MYIKYKKILKSNHLKICESNFTKLPTIVKIEFECIIRRADDSEPICSFSFPLDIEIWNVVIMIVIILIDASTRGDGYNRERLSVRQANQR